MAKKRKNSFVLSVLVLMCLVAAGYTIYQKFFVAVKIKDKSYTYLYIEQGDTFEDVIEKASADIVPDKKEAFAWLAKKMELDNNIHPGKYRINNGMNMRQVINLLKYNKQEKVKLTFNSQIRDLDEFVKYVDEKLAMESDDLEDFLSDDKKLADHFGLDPDNSFAMLVPGKYEVSWAITADTLFEILRSRYRRVWSENRINKAKSIGFSVPEVITLASIVQSESSIESEQRKIAGVYINRLRRNMPLQADPTLKFANKRYADKRVYDKDKEINSPYNTYRFKGLPPGPICLVNTGAIDATLNYQKHNYLFFCAKPQLNGYSDFSVTYEEHRRYANAYQKAMDKLGVSR